ncbi:MAG: hypothetical protein AMXMBFR59_41170 [Rhodanobacteraceae bacterium]
MHGWSNNSWQPLPAVRPHHDYQYDAVGNITSKTHFADVYTYGDTSAPVGSGGHCGPNALAQASSGVLPEGLVRSYVCDANGNQIGETGSGQGVETRNLVFDGANLPTRISHNDNWDGSFNASNVTAFAYGPTNARYFRGERTGQPGSESELQQAYYGADGFEYEILNSSSFVYRIELGPVVYTRKSTGSTVSPSETAYQLRDRLGSTIAAADRWGHFNGTEPNNYTMEGRLRRSYDAFGSPRTVNLGHVSGQLSPQLPSLQLDPTSRRGFTEHEHLDRVRLIHMNGRVYDYRSGRFLSVDPVVQSPENSQSVNAYTYIFNNPLSGTDPSGYFTCEEKSGQCSGNIGEIESIAQHKDGTVTATNKDGQSIELGKVGDKNVRAVVGAFVINALRNVPNGAEAIQGIKEQLSRSPDSIASIATRKDLALPPSGERVGREVDGAILTFADTASQGVATLFGEKALGMDPEQMAADKEAFERRMGPLKYATLLNLRSASKKIASVAGDSAKNTAKNLSAQAARGIRSLEKRIAEHEEKLAKFRASPTIRPGMEGQSMEKIQAAQQSRIRHLEKEIQTFKENIEKLRNGGGND